MIWDLDVVKKRSINEVFDYCSSGNSTMLKKLEVNEMLLKAGSDSSQSLYISIRFSVVLIINFVLVYTLQVNT